MRLVELALATWRLSNLLVNEDGPKDIFLKLRKASGIVYNDNGDVVSWNDWTPLTCAWCTSLYVASFMLLAPRFISKILAVSALSVLIDKNSNVRSDLVVNVVTQSAPVESGEIIYGTSRN